MTCLYARIRTDLGELPWWSRAETSPPNEGFQVPVPTLVGELRPHCFPTEAQL